jgi:pimeloyl-ACP methyl ester carboxylesterase
VNEATRKMSTPFIREAGHGTRNGDGVVCVHANASSSGQWRDLMTELASTFHVLAADTYGAGKSPPWPSDRTVRLRDEVDLLEPAFALAGDPFAIVGHSYGAAVALIAAVTQPERVSALALFEPTLFAVVDAETPAPNDADGIRQAVADASTALAAGNPDGAAACFIDFWMGANSWEQTAESRRGPVAASMANVGGWADALFDEPTPLSAFATLDIPVLYMTGADSPASSLGVARLLTSVLPNVEVVDFPATGHMGPITHPAQVNAAISEFLQKTR